MQLCYTSKQENYINYGAINYAIGDNLQGEKFRRAVFWLQYRITFTAFAPKNQDKEDILSMEGRNTALKVSIKC